MNPTRRNFVGLVAGILGWFIAPQAGRAMTPVRKSKRDDAVWVVKWIKGEAERMVRDIKTAHDITKRCAEVSR